MALGLEKQQNIAVNKARHLIFFEGSDLAYNYKTQQWTATPGYTGLSPYSINAKTFDIGLVVFSGSAVHLQGQSITYPALEAKLTTGAQDPNEGGRGVLLGARPLSIGGTHSFRVGTQDKIGGDITYTSSVSPNLRSGFCDFRAEGRYVRLEHTISGGFTTSMGADVQFSPQGRV